MLRAYLNLPRPVHLLCLGALINRLGMFIIPFLTLYLRDRLGLSTELATQAMGCYGGGAVVGSLVGGHLADRIGRRTVMLIALFGGAALMLGYSVLRSGPVLLAATFVLAMVMDLYRPAAQAMLADLTPPAQRPHAFTLMYVAINLGFAIAPALGGLLAQYSFLLLFIGDAATSCVFGLIILFAIQETLIRHQSTPAADPASAAAPPPDVGVRAAIAHILRDRVFLAFCTASFLTALVYVQSLSTFPLFLGGLGIDAGHYGRIIAINGLLIVVGQIPITAFVTRFDRGRILALASFLVAVGFGLNAVATRQWHFAVLVVVWTIGEMLQAPLFGPIISDLAPKPLRARYMGAFGVTFHGAAMFGAPLGGLLLARAGGNYIWLTSAILATSAATLYVTIRRRIAAQ